MGRNLFSGVRFLTAVSVLAITMVVPASAKQLSEVKPNRQGMSAERLQRVTDMAQRYVDEGRFAGMITLIARRGEIVHFEATGNKGVDDDRALEKDDLFRIYSMTKPITAAAIMQLYEQGKWHLSDPVSKYIPELKGLEVLTEDGGREPVRSEMTMQQLLTHTTGLSYGFNPKGDPVDQLYVDAQLFGAQSHDDFVARVAKLPLKFHPGDQWHYSIAVDITGIVVERLSGMRFDKYLEENIFKPLGMTDTFFGVPEAKRDRFLPNHYINPENGQLARIPDDQFSGLASYIDPKVYSGGGGLVSSTMDYLRFAEAMRNGGELNGVRILAPKTVQYMTQNHLDASIVAGGNGEQPTLGGRLNGFGFGLGFGLVTDTSAGGVMGSVGEFNWGGAAGTVFWIDPVEELVVIGMVQLMGSPHPFRSDLKVATYQAIDELAED